MAKVVLADSKCGISEAVREVFKHFGGAKRMLRSSGDVYIKVNGVGSDKHVYTDPEVLRETISYLRSCGAKNIYVIENCTQANFTRLVFASTGFLQVCRETGSVPVYLDETEEVPIFLEGIEEFVDISSFVLERLVQKRSENLYISIPKLKTHSMSQVTLSIKNQFGFIHQRSRIADHNYRIHQKFADLYRFIQPDFVLIDGIKAINHGHYPTSYNANRCIVDMGLIFGGNDALATDVVGAAIMGFDLKEVEHLRLSDRVGIGTGDIDKIEIINRKLFEERKSNLTYDLLDDYPKEINFLRGKDRCCREGCRRNTETLIEMLYRDYGGKGGFTVLMGKGIEREAAEAIRGRAHLAGSCAIQDYGIFLKSRLGKRNITSSPGCNNLAMTTAGLCRQMGIHPLRLSGENPLKSAALLVVAKLKGSKANIVPLF